MRRRAVRIGLSWSQIKLTIGALHRTPLPISKPETVRLLHAGLEVHNGRGFVRDSPDCHIACMMRAPRELQNPIPHSSQPRLGAVKFEKSWGRSCKRTWKRCLVDDERYEECRYLGKSHDEIHNLLGRTHHQCRSIFQARQMTLIICTCSAK